MLSQRPLRGIRVLDLSRVLAGPFCAMNLADLGAEVIKIEMPERGDDSRGYRSAHPEFCSDSGYFYSVNRGKREHHARFAQGRGRRPADRIGAQGGCRTGKFLARHDGALQPRLGAAACGESAADSLLDIGLRPERPDGQCASLRYRRAGARRHDERDRTGRRRADPMRRIGRRSRGGALWRRRDSGGAARARFERRGSSIWILLCSTARSHGSKAHWRATRRPATCQGRSVRAILRLRRFSSFARAMAISSRDAAMRLSGSASAMRSAGRN